MFSPLPDARSNEDAFVARYSRLTWARQIVGGDREAAEYLVHDAFFNVTASQATPTSARRSDSNGKQA